MAKKENPVAKWLREAVGMQPGGTSEEQRNLELRGKQVDRILEEQMGIPTDKSKMKKDKKQ